VNDFSVVSYCLAIEELFPLPRQTRRTRHLDDRQQTRAILQLLKESPLSQIVAELEEHFQFFEQTVHVSHNASGATYGLQAIADIVERLPRSFGERFQFDAQLIYALSLEWNGDGQKLSGTLLPRPGKEWGHESACIPFGSLNGQQKSINLIHMPGDDALEEVDLLTYPFLCHEMAHNSTLPIHTFGPPLKEHWTPTSISYVSEALPIRDAQGAKVREQSIELPSSGVRERITRTGRTK
jgi:hypothetical protein